MLTGGATVPVKPKYAAHQNLEHFIGEIGYPAKEVVVLSPGSNTIHS